VDHDRAERLIGERLDGEHLAAAAALELDRHLEGCAECRAFERAAWRLRERVRFEVAPAVPDLVEPIMRSVAAESGRPLRRLRVVGSDERPWRRRRLLPRATPAIAAAVMAALVGSIVVGGPWSGRDAPSRTAALAAQDVTRNVAGAASALDAYAARFTITEEHLSPSVPERTLAMKVWFEAPERFRLDVTDRTTDRRDATPTNLRLIVNEDRWYVARPTPCPAASCPMEETSVRNRVPFSSSAPAPTDLVLPDDVDVLGTGTVLGRDAVRVQIPFERAASLFPFLSLGGDWRPFFATDRVRIWLDAASWFPLKWEVLPASGEQRESWARRFGLPSERPDVPIFTVEATSVDLSTPRAGVFDVPATPDVRDQAAESVPLEAVEDEAGFVPLAPAALDGLEPYRAVVLTDDAAPSSIVAYTDGLSFLKLAETRSWRANMPFGPVDARAEQVSIGGGVAYFEPATSVHGRRLAIHARDTDLYLESNLPRARLLEIGSELAVTGLPLPAAWTSSRTAGGVTERVTLDEARAAVPFDVHVPSDLPAGFGLASVELVRSGDVAGVTLYLRDDDVDTGAGEIRIHLEPASSLPPTTGARPSVIDVGGADGRWTAARSTLEWVDDGLYRSIDAPGFGLATVLRIATS
jgi:outer membrane lipoprotein-sorting protein